MEEELRTHHREIFQIPSISGAGLQDEGSARRSVTDPDFRLPLPLVFPVRQEGGFLSEGHEASGEGGVRTDVLRRTREGPFAGKEVDQLPGALDGAVAGPQLHISLRRAGEEDPSSELGEVSGKGESSIQERGYRLGPGRAALGPQEAILQLEVKPFCETFDVSGNHRGPLRRDLYDLGVAAVRFVELPPPVREGLKEKLVAEAKE